MIYHNYSPYYYGPPHKINNKFINGNNLYDSTPYSNTNINNTYTISHHNVNNKYYSTQYHKSPFYNTKHINNFTLSKTVKDDIKEISIKKKTPTKSNTDVIFEIFGIKLYFDDILLICLIFFLYNEGVQDQYLFIVLILLLLS